MSLGESTMKCSWSSVDIPIQNLKGGSCRARAVEGLKIRRGRTSTNVVGIICPPDFNRVNRSAKFGVSPGSDSHKSRRPFQLWFDSTYKVHQISHSPKSTVIERVKSKFKQCMYLKKNSNSCSLWYLSTLLFHYLIPHARKVHVSQQLIKNRNLFEL